MKKKRRLKHKPTKHHQWFNLMFFQTLKSSFLQIKRTIQKFRETLRREKNSLDITELRENVAKLYMVHVRRDSAQIAHAALLRVLRRHFLLLLLCFLYFRVFAVGCNFFCVNFSVLFFFLRRIHRFLVSAATPSSSSSGSSWLTNHEFCSH